MVLEHFTPTLEMDLDHFTLTKRGVAMDIKNLTPDERFELVMECRRSGLTDHQWLEEHGISKSIFYYWISQFRKKGYPNIPEPMMQHSPHKAQPQEVVKVNILPDAVPLEQNAPVQTSYS